MWLGGWFVSLLVNQESKTMFQVVREMEMARRPTNQADWWLACCNGDGDGAV